MTDLPHDPLDELASAHLDGVTSPDEARRIEGDPALLERVARLGTARDAVRLPDGPVDADRRELAIAAALAAVDGADVVSMDEARRRRTRTWIRVAGAAAAVALAIVVIPQLTDDDEGQDATTLAAGDADEQAAESTTARQDSADDDAAIQSATSDLFVDGTTTTAPNPTGSGTTLAVVDLGTVADLDALAEAARAELDAPSAPVATPPADPPERDACLTTLQGAGPDGTGTSVLNAVARVGGQDVVVTVTLTPGDIRTLRAYAVSGCALVDTRTI